MGAASGAGDGAAGTGCARRATARDLHVLVELRVEMFRAMGMQTGSPEWQQAARDWYAERLDHPDYGFFVVEVAGEVVASAVGAIREATPSPASPAGRDVLISNVCTFPDHRGSGYATAAFHAVVQWARGTGVTRAELMATDGGRRIYERVGFVTTRWPTMRMTLQTRDEP